MKKILIKTIFTMLVIFSIIINFNVFASAETIYTNTKDTRITDIPSIIIDKNNNNKNYTNIGGISIGKKKNSMFVLKAKGNETDVALYYFPNINNTNKYAIFTIPNAGHANSMTIDNSNIYISAWAKTKSNNYIIRIKRSKIASMPFNQKRAVIKEDNINYKKLDTKYKIYNKTNGTYSYSTATSISAITKYKETNKFIAHSVLPSGTSDNDFIFSTATIESYNGKETFMIELSEKSTFLVKNNLKTESSTSQDIYYSEYNDGLYIPRWYENNQCKNVIVWAHLNSSYSTKTINGLTYKYYIPDKINVNRTSEKRYGVKMYSKYEIESLAFTENNDLLFSCNIKYTNDYKQAYINKNNKNPHADGIFKLTKNDNSRFI